MKRIFLAVVLIGAWGGCSREAPPAAPLPRVTVIQPVVATVTNWDEYPGHIEAVECVEVRPRISGYIESIHFEDGAEVRVGDELFVVDPRPYQATHDRMRAERERAEARAELARNDLDRAKHLRDTRVISEEQFDNRSKLAREAEASLAAARAAETAAQVDLDYTRIKAPIAGRIGRRLVTAGNLVQGGGMVPGTVLATLVSMDPVYCYFDADERSFARYRWHAGSDRDPPVCELGLAAEEGFPHKGRVDFFDNRVDPSTGTIRVRAVFANPGRALVPGMFAKVRVPAGPPVEALLVPAVAIGSDQGHKFVLVVDGDNVVGSRPVEVGRQHGAMRAVVEGLSPEERVVVNGLMLARPGSRVEVVGATGAEAGSAGPEPTARDSGGSRP